MKNEENIVGFDSNVLINKIADILYDNDVSDTEFRLRCQFFFSIWANDWKESIRMFTQR